MTLAVSSILVCRHRPGRPGKPSPPPGGSRHHSRGRKKPSEACLKGNKFVPKRQRNTLEKSVRKPAFQNVGDRFPQTLDPLRPGGDLLAVSGPDEIPDPASPDPSVDVTDPIPHIEGTSHVQRVLPRG